jgi:hypothetical protein
MDSSGNQTVFDPKEPDTPKNNLKVTTIYDPRDDDRYIYDPEVSRPVPLRRKQEDILKTYLQYSKNPREDRARINGSSYLSTILDIPFDVAHRNFDRIAESWTGIRTKPTTFTETLKKSWDIGNANVRLGRLYHRYMFDPENEELARKIEEIETAMPAPDEQLRSLPTQMLKAALEMIPYTVSGLTQGAKQAGLSAAGAAGVTALLGQTGPQIALPEEIVTVPVAAATAFTVAMATGAAQDIMKIEAGLMFKELMDMADETGMTIGTPIARIAALGVGGINAALEIVQLQQIPGIRKLLSGAAKRGIFKALADDSIKRTALSYAKEYVGAIPKEVATELAQETTNIIVGNIAKEVNNKVNGSTFTQDQADDVLNRLKETALQATKGFIIISAPGAFIEAGTRRKTDTGTRIPEKKPEVKKEEIPEKPVYDIENIPGEIERREVELQETFRTYAERPEEALQRAVELEGELNDLYELERGKRREQGRPEVEEPWQITREEFEERREAQAIAQREKETVEQQQQDELKETIKRYIPAMSEEEATGAALLIDLRARAKGLTRDHYIKQTFESAIFAEPTEAHRNLAQGQKAAVEFKETGKAIFYATEKSDFSSWVHELGHIYRRELTPEQDNVVREWTGFQGEWGSEGSRHAEEQFAEGFTEYLESGKAPSPELQSVFQRFKEWLRRIYRTMRGTIQPSEDIKRVYAQYFGEYEDTYREHVSEATEREGVFAQPARGDESTMSGMDSDASNYVVFDENIVEIDEHILYQQDEHELSVQQAVEGGQPVPEEVLREYSDRNWAQKELEQRKSLLMEAKQFDSAEEFAAFHAAFDLEDRPRGYYIYLWNLSQRKPTEEILTRREQNNRFIESLTKPTVEAYLLEMHLRGMHERQDPDIKTGAMAVQGKGKLKESHYNRILGKIKADPTYYRELFAEAVEDFDTLQEMKEESVDYEQEQLEKLRREVKDLRREKEYKDKRIKNLEIYKYGLEKSLSTEETRHKTDVTKLESELKEVSKSAKAEARKQTALAKKETLKKERERKRTLDKRAKEKKRIREYVQKLIRDIFTPVSAGVQHEFAEHIRSIQKGFSQRGPRSAEYRMRENLKMLREERPEIRFPEQTLQELERKSIHDLTLNELESLHEEVQQLRDKGRRAKDQADLAERLLIHGAIRTIVNNIGETQKVKGLGVKSTEKKRETRILKKERLLTLTADRVCQMLDGNRKGPTYDWLIRQAENAIANKMEYSKTRLEAGLRKLSELGIKPRDLTKTRFVNGINYEVQELMGIYAFSMNSKANQRLLYGNNINHNDVLAVIRALTLEEIEFVEYMMQDFNEHLPRLITTFIVDQNKALKLETNYFPMLVRDMTYDTMPQQITEDLITARSGPSKSYVTRGFTIERITVAPQHQPSMRLDAFSIWQTMIARQEEYINKARLTKRLHKIFGSREVQEAIIQKFGKDANKWIRDQINEFANPLASTKNFNGLERLLSVLRANVGLAALSWNTLTVFKQIPSIFLVMGRTTYARLAGAAFQMVNSPKELIQFIHERDPHMKTMNYDPVLQEMKMRDKGRYTRIVQKVGETGFKGILVVDKVVKSIIWKSVYDNYMAREGATEANAIHEARRAVIETQPGGEKYFLPHVLKQHEFFRWATLFSSQITKIYNIATYDIPQTFRKGEIIDGLRMTSGFIIAAIAIGMLQRKRPPEGIGEGGLMMLEQIINSVPVIGGVIMSAVKGYPAKINPTFETIYRITGMAKALTDSEKDRETKQYYITRALEEALFITGHPTVQAKRMIEFAHSGDPWEIVGGPPKE